MSMMWRTLILIHRTSIDAVERVVDVFFQMATTAHSVFHIEKAEGNPAVFHAEGSSTGYEKAKHAIERDLQHVISKGTSWTNGSDLTYSVHYSDVNGLSRLENYILGLEIAGFLSMSCSCRGVKNVANAIVRISETSSCHFVFDASSTRQACTGVCYLDLSDANGISCSSACANRSIG